MMFYQSQSRSIFGSSSLGHKSWTIRPLWPKTWVINNCQPGAVLWLLRFPLHYKSGVRGGKALQDLCSSAVHTEPRLPSRLSPDHMDMGRKLEDNWMQDILIIVKRSFWNFETWMLDSTGRNFLLLLLIRTSLLIAVLLIMLVMSY